MPRLHVGALSSMLVRSIIKYYCGRGILQTLDVPSRTTRRRFLQIIGATRSEAIGEIFILTNVSIPSYEPAR